MDSKPVVSLLLCLVLSLTLSHQILAAPGGDLISTTCEHTMYKELCASTLRADPDSKQADLAGLTSIAIKIAMNNATQVYNVIKQQHQQEQTTGQQPTVQQCLADCTENYMDAVDQLEDSMAALDSKAYTDVNAWIQAAMSDAESCQDGFKEQNGQASSITDKGTMFSQLCSNALALTNLLASGKA